jgi:deazaflavin-dependent oxidoreductase (nitroreductase family)
LDREREAAITTIGRRSGRKHRVVVWWAAGSSAVIYVMAGYGPRTDWARNAVSGTGTLVQIGRQRFAANARVLSPGAEHADAARLLARKYHPYPGEWDRGHILALELSVA